MSKLLRSELKEIVKECLVEILSEGIGNKSHAKRKNINSSKQRRLSSDIPSKNPEKRKSYLDSIGYGDIPLVKENQNKAVNTNITKDPILNAILADTAKTTLKEQLTAERRPSAVSPSNMDAAAKIVNENNPEALFGAETSSKWAQLAFFDQ